MQSTPLTCVRTRCRTSLLPTAVLHWYVLLVCRQHRRPAFVHVAKPRCYPLLSYIGTCSSPVVNIVDLRSYALQNLVATHCSPTFVRAARLPSTSSTCVRRRCKTSLLPTAVLHWYVFLVCRQHRRPAFVRVAEPRWYTPLSYIRTRCTSAAITAGYIRTHCSSAINIVDLCSYALQNLVATHCCPTFVRAARLPSTSSTCVCTRCRSSLVPTALLHSYALLVCGQHR